MSYKQDSLAAGLAFLMRSSAQRPLLDALRAFERPLFRRAHCSKLGSRRHKMRVRRQHKASTALTSLTENPVPGVYRLEFLPNVNRLKGQEICQSSFYRIGKTPRSHGWRPCLRWSDASSASNPFQRAGKG